MTQRRMSGMNTLLVIWAGQLVSMVGSQMASFALAIWAFQETGRASELAAIAFFNWGTTVVVSPFARVLVDRWNRKLTMMLSDLVAVGATVAVLLLCRSGDLRIWHLYAQAVAVGAGSAFQWPAFSATTSALLRKEDYGRASGLNGFAHSVAGIGAPPLAALLLTIVEIDVLLLVAFLTFAVAIATLAAVVVPPTPQVESDVEQKEGFGRQFQDGWHLCSECNVDPYRNLE